MPKSHQYFTGSLIYARGDEAGKLFILQSGKVSLSSLDPETGADVRDLVSPGEFFGVKSALGRFPREENAVALADSTAMVFTVPEFEAFAMSNPKIIIKMLKVFSNQMRRVHTQIAKLKENEAVNPEEGLFSIGARYLKLKRYPQAKYIFSRYLIHYPSGAQAALAAKNLKAVDNALANAVIKSQQQGTAKEYREAISLISNHEYEKAIQAFNKIIETCKEQEWLSKSEYAVGNCLFLLEKFDDCIKHFSDLLSKNPDHPDAKEAMFYMGEASRRLGNKAQAAVWYNKILAMPDLEAGGMRARVKQALKDLGV
ncbi:MAG: cyclic nucleotide-binding domain-containing protein [Treponema sp.]|jgi:CRP-like cAMP-binding protein|nr:cyclic nucleotide-binding domain-containing protein [Treponema sp.]